MLKPGFYDRLTLGGKERQQLSQGSVWSPRRRFGGDERGRRWLG